MPQAFNNNAKRGKKQSKLITRLLLPMLLLVIFQLVVFFTVLTAGGEFSYIKEYAYNTLTEKTENRKGYIENELQQKIPFVHESADKVNDSIAGLLAESNASVTDLQTNKELNRQIMESSLDSLIELMRRSMSNDVYLILETGSLYSGDNGTATAKAALYLRDLDPKSDAGYSDLMMEIGFSSISQNFGITLDSGWSLHFEPGSENTADFDFYYKTIRTAQENSSLPQEQLGYWSDFSSVSHNAAGSMKYTVPLIAEDGTVYGIIGIGLTENNILSNLPASDFLSENACYVLGHTAQRGKPFDIITHSGSSFNRLVGNAEKLEIPVSPNSKISEFTLSTGIDSAGSVQYMSLYNPESPYINEQWALISVADRESVLRPYSNLVQMLLISAFISLIIAVIVIILSCRKVVKPISEAIKTMNANKEYSQVIRFSPSRIYELDMLTDAITQLQINVHDFSSQVSQMIRIADMGLGTFMYDRIDDSMFVGQSLFNLLKSEFRPDEDIMMSRQEFLDSIISDETRMTVSECLQITQEEAQIVREYSVAQEDGSVIWMRLSLVHNKNKSIGILQDITHAMTERKRIEYERDYDSTTGLLNRHAYNQRLEELFRDKSALKITAFMMIDLDNLKYVNDTYGHDFGDDYIRTAANALKKFLNYGGIVSRLSGDEFNVCLPGFSSRGEIMEIISEVRADMLQSYCLLPDGTHFKIRASAGISWYPDDAAAYDLLMKYADFAMYTIKHSTKGELAEFDKSAYEKDSVLITGVEEMNRIIDECRVRYAFQSIISAKTGEVYGYEALMRPQSSILKSPLDLLRIAKTGAKLYEIERLTWMKALDDFQRQIDAGHIAKNSHIFINSISNSVLEASDADAIEAAHSGLLPQIVLEILESESVNEEYNARKMRRIKKWNAQIALDDFGSGYNSEYALITIQPDIIKIDRAIISGCDKDVSRRMIIRNLVKLVSEKNILVLAEGVETESELETVISCGVDLLQGYYFNRPVFEPEPLAPEMVEMIKDLADNNQK